VSIGDGKHYVILGLPDSGYSLKVRFLEESGCRGHLVGAET
jgi:hypothetical protein